MVRYKAAPVIIGAIKGVKFKPIPARTKVFENSFFACCIKEWDKSTTKLEI